MLLPKIKTPASQSDCPFTGTIWLVPGQGWHSSHQSQRSSVTAASPARTIGLKTVVRRDGENVGSDWVDINSTPHFKCLQTSQLLIIYYTKVLESGVLAGSWKRFTSHQQKSSSSCHFSLWTRDRCSMEWETGSCSLIQPFHLLPKLRK